MSGLIKHKNGSLQSEVSVQRQAGKQVCGRFRVGHSPEHSGSCSLAEHVYDSLRQLNS